ncbi:hypothetical protein BDW62DRAFT_209572 [Aspergillus aurantiobrunneus]
MPRGYTCLNVKSPRSFLFIIIANVGSHGTSRSLAAERALADDWYCQSYVEGEGSERPSIPDTAQPPFVVPDSYYLGEKVQSRPELLWYNNVHKFPFTTTCLLLGLLCNNSDSINSNLTCPGDVQLQPLLTVFCSDCTKYGLVVLDISNLDKVKYSIIGFPVYYMAEVFYRGEDIGWDPVKDHLPEKEPDIWLYKYFSYASLEGYPYIYRLEGKLLVNIAALDCISVPRPPVSSQD